MSLGDASRDQQSKVTSKLTSTRLATSRNGARWLSSHASGSIASQLSRKSRPSGSHPSTAVTHGVVSIEEERSLPRELFVVEGGAVEFRVVTSLVKSNSLDVWQQKDRHGVAVDATQPAFSTGALCQGQSATWVCSELGVFRYESQVFAFITGTVTVVPPPVARTPSISAAGSFADTVDLEVQGSDDFAALMGAPAVAGATVLEADCSGVQLMPRADAAAVPVSMNVSAGAWYDSCCAAVPPSLLPTIPEAQGVAECAAMRVGWPMPGQIQAREVCSTCKTGYVSRLSRLRCEACDLYAGAHDKSHRPRPPPITCAYYEPNLIPSAPMRSILAQMTDWWDTLSAADAASIFDISDQDQAWGWSPCKVWALSSNALAMDLDDIEAAARHPDMVLAAAELGGIADARLIAAGVALRRAVEPSLNDAEEGYAKPSADSFFLWLQHASEGLFLRTSPIHIGDVNMQQPANWPAALAALLEVRLLTSFNMAVIYKHCQALYSKRSKAKRKNRGGRSRRSAADGHANAIATKNSTMDSERSSAAPQQQADASSLALPPASAGLPPRASTPAASTVASRGNDGTDTVGAGSNDVDSVNVSTSGSKKHRRRRGKTRSKAPAHVRAADAGTTSTITSDDQSSSTQRASTSSNTMWVMHPNGHTYYMSADALPALIAQYRELAPDMADLSMKWAAAKAQACDGPETRAKSTRPAPRVPHGPSVAGHGGKDSSPEEGVIVNGWHVRTAPFTGVGCPALWQGQEGPTMSLASYSGVPLTSERRTSAVGRVDKCDLTSDSEGDEQQQQSCEGRMGAMQVIQIPLLSPTRRIFAQRSADASNSDWLSDLSLGNSSVATFSTRNTPAGSTCSSYEDGAEMVFPFVMQCHARRSDAGELLAIQSLAQTTEGSVNRSAPSDSLQLRSASSAAGQRRAVRPATALQQLAIPLSATASTWNIQTQAVVVEGRAGDSPRSTSSAAAAATAAAAHESPTTRRSSSASQPEFSPLANFKRVVPSAQPLRGADTRESVSLSSVTSLRFQPAFLNASPQPTPKMPGACGPDPSAVEAWIHMHAEPTKARHDSDYATTVGNGSTPASAARSRAASINDPVLDRSVSIDAMPSGQLSDSVALARSARERPSLVSTRTDVMYEFMPTSTAHDAAVSAPGPEREAQEASSCFDTDAVARPIITEPRGLDAEHSHAFGGHGGVTSHEHATSATTADLEASICDDSTPLEPITCHEGEIDAPSESEDTLLPFDAVVLEAAEEQARHRRLLLSTFGTVPIQTAVESCGCASSSHEAAAIRTFQFKQGLMYLAHASGHAAAAAVPLAAAFRATDAWAARQDTCEFAKMMDERWVTALAAAPREPSCTGQEAAEPVATDLASSSSLTPLTMRPSWAEMTAFESAGESDSDAGRCSRSGATAELFPNASIASTELRQSAEGRPSSQQQQQQQPESSSEPQRPAFRASRGGKKTKAKKAKLRAAAEQRAKAESSAWPVIGTPPSSEVGSRERSAPPRSQDAGEGLRRSPERLPSCSTEAMLPPCTGTWGSNSGAPRSGASKRFQTLSFKQDRERHTAGSLGGLGWGKGQASNGVTPFNGKAGHNVAQTPLVMANADRKWRS